MNDLLSTYNLKSGTALTIGKFDGLHEGHRKLIEACVQTASKEGLKSLVLCAMIPDQKRIFSFDETREMLSGMKVDLTLPLLLSPDLRNESAKHFLSETLLSALHMTHFFSGDDFCFGKNREGTPSFLERCAKELGFTYTTIPLVLKNGLRVKSSDARDALQIGEMEEVSALLGRHYHIRGTVIHGNNLGTKMHFPTANLKPDPMKLLPPFGVYLVKADLHGAQHFGIANLGVRPTVSKNGEVLLETHFPDHDETLYGETLTVEFLRFLRPERHFDSLSALSSQIETDLENVHRILMDDAQIKD